MTLHHVYIAEGNIITSCAQFSRHARIALLQNNSAYCVGPSVAQISRAQCVKAKRPYKQALFIRQSSTKDTPGITTIHVYIHNHAPVECVHLLYIVYVLFSMEVSGKILAQLMPLWVAFSGLTKRPNDGLHWK